MGILSDRQIRACGVIAENFAEMTDTPGILSYGCGSYGYTARVGYKFEVFTPYPPGLIDPKNFDKRLLTFVDVSKEKYIDIPPHSFVLAETVETFHIPRGVLCVVVGKCLTGDSRVFYPETGEYLPLREHGEGKRVAAVEFLIDGDSIRLRKSSRLRPSGRRRVFLVRTHSGAEIRATSNHPFMKEGHDGGWVPLSDIAVGDKVLRANYLPFFGTTKLCKDEARLLALMIADGQCDTPGTSPVYTKHDGRMVRLFKKCVSAVLPHCQVTCSEGKHAYRVVNHAGRGGVAEKNRASQWLDKYGLACKAAGKFVPQVVMTADKATVRVFLRTLFSGDSGIYLTDRGTVRFEYCSASKRLVQEVAHLLTRLGINGTLRTKRVNGVDYCTLHIFRKMDQARLFTQIGFVSGTKKAKFYDESVSRYVSTKLAGAAVLATAWDAVVSIEPAGEEDTFDIEVEQDHNFVAEGLVVHNSTYARTGLIVNVTPLEPEWRGIVTVELSNTTPLPLRVYAGEGIMQCLFFRSDERSQGVVRFLQNYFSGRDFGAARELPEADARATCGTSYADRKGRYQDQTGITHPTTDKS